MLSSTNGLTMLNIVIKGMNDLRNWVEICSPHGKGRSGLGPGLPLLSFTFASRRLLRRPSKCDWGLWISLGNPVNERSMQTGDRRVPTPSNGI